VYGPRACSLCSYLNTILCSPRNWSILPRCKKKITRQTRQLLALMARHRTRKSTYVTPVAQEGKPHAKTGRNTQTNSTADHQAGKSEKLLEAPDFEIHRTLPIGTYFKSNYGCCASLAIFKGTEATALSSRSIWLRLGHVNVLGSNLFGLCSLSSVLPRFSHEQK
jgi:hypothetical protein